MIDWRRLSALTPQDVADALGVPLVSVQLVWDAINPVEQLRAIRGRYVAAIWDGETPLNGWAPEQVRQVFNPPRYGVIAYTYLLADGKILDLQPSVPGTNEPILRAQAQDVADRLADQRAMNDALPALYAQAVEVLRGLLADAGVDVTDDLTPDVPLKDVIGYATDLLTT